MSDPFHRVRYLAGSQYREAYLRDAGVFIQLCPSARGTAPCSGYPENVYVLDSSVDKKAPTSYGSVPDDLDSTAAAGGGVTGPAGSHTRGSAGPQPGPSGRDGQAGGSSFVLDDPDENLWPDEVDLEKLDEGEAEAMEAGDEELEGDGEEGAEVRAAEGKVRERGRDAKIRKDHWGYDVKVIVHEHDIHQLGVAYCKCTAGGAGMAKDEQLLRLGGLFPATQKDPGTLFTVRGLAYHQLDRLECKTAPEAMVRKIRRHTSPMHPAAVPVSELSRSHSQELTFVGSLSGAAACYA